MIADDFVWAGDVEPEKSETPIEAMVKIRLASKPVKAFIERAGENDLALAGKTDFRGTAWKVTFEEPQRAVAPGQSVVLYKDGLILGGGIICSKF